MRVRDVFAVLVGLAVVGAVGLGGWIWLSDTLEEDDPEDDLGTAVAAYLDAWEAGDHLAMTSLVREAPEDFVEVHEQMIDGLMAQGLELITGEPDQPVEGRATVPLTIAVDVPVMDEPLTWDTQLRLIRSRGEWQVDWSLSTLHPELRPTWMFDAEVRDVDRAPILAADGTELAGHGTLMMLGFRPPAVRDADAVVEAFEQALPGSGERAARQLGRDDLRGDWFYEVATVSEARAEEAWEILRDVHGTYREPTAGGRILMDAGFAQHVVGVVGEATAEEIEELGDEYEPGSLVGRYGLERLFEDRLVGGELYRAGIRGAGDDEFRVLLGEGQEEGSGPVTTTIEVAVQRAIEQALAGIDAEAAIVVVDGRDGAIAGAASRPLTGYNRAFEGRFSPGSTFKIVVAEALLAAGADLDDEVSCPAETLVGGLPVPNAGGRALGDTTLEAAFAESCNTTFARLGADLGAEVLVEAAERFGFGVDPNVPLAAFGGSFPEPQDTAEAGAASFGQARVEASVLHMASIAAATVHGTWHQPYLLEDGAGESRGLATGAAEPLRRLLRAVVTDGTGQAAAVDGEEVGGKTGSAQMGEATHAWFVGTWGDYGFAILVEGGGAGGEVAAPIAHDLIRALAGLVTGDEDPLEPAEEVEEDAAGAAEEGTDPEVDDDQVPPPEEENPGEVPTVEEPEGDPEPEADDHQSPDDEES